MGRRASLILPKKFRRGFRGATGGGGGGGVIGGFTTLGPNAPSGLISPFPDFLGDTFPARSGTSAITPNIYGMGATYPESRAWEIVPDADSPSGSALRWNFYGSGTPRVGCAWKPLDAGGGSPVRGTIRSGIYDATVPRKWRKMYIHMWHKFSPNFSVHGTLQVDTLHASGVTTAGSTVTHIVDSTKSWIPGEHVGRFARHGSGISTASQGAVILSNDATSFDVSSFDRYGYMFTGEAYQIFTWTPTATVTTSAGCKGWFWPLQQARMVGPVPGRGDGAILGPWNAPKDVSSRWPENHYHGCWNNFLGGGTMAGAPGGPIDSLSLQLSQKWESPWPEDANDLPVWNFAGRYTHNPPIIPANEIPYTRGDVRKMEYYLELNTPGVANGIWRAWADGVLIRDITNVFYTEQYVSALAVEGGTGLARPVIGGASRDAAYEIVECYWQSLYSAMTFGGIGQRYVPTNDQSASLLAMAVSGAP